MADWRSHLVHNPAVARGQLTARGTRVPVTVILDSVAEGSTRAEILADYPSLTDAHIDAALAYAADLTHEATSLSVGAGGIASVQSPRLADPSRVRR